MAECKDCIHFEVCAYVRRDLPACDSFASNVVPVVMCRECIHRDGTPGQPNILCGQMHDDDFCSYGQRKETVHEVSEPRDGRS